MIMRTVDVARRAGYSVQQIRNLERDGVLPEAARTGSGYRRYGDRHVRAALTYRALTAAVGPVEAKRIIRTLHERPLSEVLAHLDRVHAQLDRERSDLRLALEAVAWISGEQIADATPADAMSVSELADALGVKASTLRHWDAEGLVVPTRLSVRGTGLARGARHYSPDDVRDARIVHQLRSAGYRVATVRGLMPELRAGQREDDLAGALAGREIAITARSRALLEAMVEFGDLLRAMQPED